MILLDNAFKYGIIGRNYYSNMDKAILASYRMLKNFSLDDISKALDETKETSRISIPKCVSVLLYIKKKEFSNLFIKEIIDIDRLLIIYRAIKILDIPISKEIINAFSDWIIKNLNEDIAINHKASLREIMTRINFKIKRAMEPRIIINTRYILYNDELLPRRKAILKLKKDFIDGVFKDFHLELINKYKIGIKDVQNFLYELLDQEKESVILECIKNSQIIELRMLKEIFPEGIPINIKKAAMGKLHKGSFYDLQHIKDILNIPELHKDEVSIFQAKIFIDNSYSMTRDTEDIVSFIDYCSYVGIKPEKIFLVNEEVVEFDNIPESLVSLNSKCSCEKIISSISENDVCVFITDGNVDIYNLTKLFRTKFTYAKLVIWFLNKNDHPSKFKNIYYFYGKGEDLSEIICEFITKE